MGLLDFLGSGPDDPRTLATMQLAMGLLRNGKNLGRGMLEGGMGYSSAMASANERQRQRALEERRLAMEESVKQAQISEYQAQARQRQEQAAAQQQQAQRAQQFQVALGQASAPTSPQQALAAGGGPTPANAAQIGAPRTPDWNALAMQHPEQIDLIKKLAEARNFGRPEVARTVDGMDPQGRPATMQLDKFGAPIGQALQQWKAPERIDTGGQINIWDPVTQRTLQTLGKTNSPDALLGAQTTMRGQNMVDQRSRDANAAAGAGVGKYEYKQDAQGNWLAFPKAVDPAAGPIQPVPVSLPSRQAQGSRDALSILDMAGPLIQKATGSYIGAGADQVAQAFGVSTGGAQATAQLKALEGALMMKQPRMEGPQSDKDTQLYRQMAGQIGDPTIPARQKQAALGVIRQLHERYAGSSSGGATGSWDSGPGLDDLLKKYGN